MLWIFIYVHVKAYQSLRIYLQVEIAKYKRHIAIYD